MPAPCSAVDILISLLKQYGIRKAVLSPGSRNIPFVNAIVGDPAFSCYSVVDERNAAFFALGLSQQSGEPAVLACTSGTAASNYLSGMTEAYYAHVPLAVITFDRSPYTLDQLETQKIDQLGIFKSVCKRSVNLPIIKDDDDVWYCGRLINEALISLEQHGAGPVHINVPLVGDTTGFYKTAVRETVPAKRITYIPYNRPERWKEHGLELFQSKRILIVMGQSCAVSERLNSGLRQFCRLLRVPLLSDNLANFRCEERVFSEAVMKALSADTFRTVLPELVITFGCNFQERIKDLLKAHRGEFKHWSIEPEGTVKDVFKSQTALFECTPEEFFSYYAEYAEKQTILGDEQYLMRWKQLVESIRLPELPFSNFYVIEQFCRVIPRNAILHLSILNSVRLTQFFELDDSIRVYGNVNAFGIDGCLPTFMGQAAATDLPAFLVTGDLSFFYSMNALGIVHRKNNIRILLINNGGGAEFYIRPDAADLQTSDAYIGAVHNQSAKGWAESLGYRYLSAGSAAALNSALDEFVDPSHDAPILLEVFTDMKRDGQVCLSVYRHMEGRIQSTIEGMSLR